MANHKLFSVLDAALVECCMRYGRQPIQSSLNAANAKTNRSVYPGASHANYLTNFFLTLLHPNGCGAELPALPTPNPARQGSNAPLFPKDYRPNVYEVLRAVFHVHGYAGFYNAELDCYCVPDLISGAPPCLDTSCVCCRPPFPINAFLNTVASDKQLSFDDDPNP